MEIIVFESKAFQELVNEIEIRLARIVEAKVNEAVRIAGKDMNDLAELQKAFLTIEEAASILGCSTRTLYTYRDNGLIKAVKQGGKLKFQRSELEKFIQTPPKDSIL